MEKFKLYDMVVLKNDFQGIKKDTRGVILLKYDGSSTFEVEFVDENLNTIAVVTVPEDNLRLSQ